MPMSVTVYFVRLILADSTILIGYSKDGYRFDSKGHAYAPHHAEYAKTLYNRTKRLIPAGARIELIRRTYDPQYGLDLLVPLPNDRSVTSHNQSDNPFSSTDTA